MGKMKAQEEHDKMGGSPWRSLGSGVLSLGPELTVWGLTFLVFFGLDIISWYYDLTISLLVAVLYGGHNRAMLEKLQENTKAGMKELTDEVRRTNDITIPEIQKKLSTLTEILTKDVVETMYRFPEFVQLGHTIEDTKQACDIDIVKGVLNDQVSLLQIEEHILTLEGYLYLLKKFSKHDELYCVNITPPIFWFSPHPLHRNFVENYASAAKTQQMVVRRLTGIERMEILRTQFQRAFDLIKNKWGDKRMA